VWRTRSIPTAHQAQTRSVGTRDEQGGRLTLGLDSLVVASCIACDVNAGRVVSPGGVIYEDAHWIADHGVDRLIRGYVVLKPRRHVHEIPDLSPDEVASLGRAVQTVVRAMRAALGSERIYICSFAETVHHLHFHLIPRYADMPALGPDLLPDLFAGQWGCSRVEAELAADRIRASLSG
jgi:diadenosine tetraphosphate (Ap4A) HIT family hydrolase